MALKITEADYDPGVDTLKVWLTDDQGRRFSVWLDFNEDSVEVHDVGDLARPNGLSQIMVIAMVMSALYDDIDPLDELLDDQPLVDAAQRLAATHRQVS